MPKIRDMRGGQWEAEERGIRPMRRERQVIEEAIDRETRPHLRRRVFGGYEVPTFPLCDLAHFTFTPHRNGAGA